MARQPKKINDDLTGEAFASRIGATIFGNLYVTWNISTLRNVQKHIIQVFQRRATDGCYAITRGRIIKVVISSQEQLMRKICACAKNLT